MSLFKCDDTSTKDTQCGTASFSIDLHNVGEAPLKPLRMAVERDVKGKILPGSILNPKGGPKKEESVTLIIRSRLDQPCDYCRDMTWAEAIAKREMEQSLNDPVARKHLLDRLYGRATESINLAQSGEIVLRVVHDDYVNPNEAKQLPESTQVDNKE